MLSSSKCSFSKLLCFAVGIHIFDMATRKVPHLAYYTISFGSTSNIVYPSPRFPQMMTDANYAIIAYVLCSRYSLTRWLLHNLLHARSIFILSTSQNRHSSLARVVGILVQIHEPICPIGSTPTVLRLLTHPISETYLAIDLLVDPGLATSPTVRCQQQKTGLFLPW
jgi:hypothetical protein